MIDPKLNKIPVDETDEESPAGGQRPQGATKPRQGLSINDTIARDANLSVGSRGVDTSGVVAGAGAGAGTTSVTPGNPGESPAPNIVPGSRGTGMGPRGSVNPDIRPTTRLDEDAAVTDEEIATRAHKCWRERGCPVGSPEVDWHRAEQELRAERLKRGANAAASGSGL